MGTPSGVDADGLYVGLAIENSGGATMNFGMLPFRAGVPVISVATPSDESLPAPLTLQSEEKLKMEVLSGRGIQIAALHPDGNLW